AQVPVKSHPVGLTSPPPPAPFRPPLAEEPPAEGTPPEPLSPPDADPPNGSPPPEAPLPRKPPLEPKVSPPRFEPPAPNIGWPPAPALRPGPEPKSALSFDDPHPIRSEQDTVMRRARDDLAREAPWSERPGGRPASAVIGFRGACGKGSYFAFRF